MQSLTLQLIIDWIQTILCSIYSVLPFDEDNANELFKKICTGDFRYPQTFSNDVIDLLNNVLVVDPNKRFTLQNIKEHHWFQSAKEEDEYYKHSEVKEEDGLMISEDADDNNMSDNKPTMIETPRNSIGSPGGKSSVSFNDDHHGLNESSLPMPTPTLTMAHSVDSTFLHGDDEKHSVGSKHKKSGSLQINVDHFDPHGVTSGGGGIPNYEDTMKQYSTSLNDSDKSDGDQIKADSVSLSASDYATSDIDSATGNSPRSIQPISMTAFDLIGIVSTQMLNNVFTRSLQDTSQQMRTFTRFVSSSTPPKILYAIQEAVCCWICGNTLKCLDFEWKCSMLKCLVRLL